MTYLTNSNDPTKDYCDFCNAEDPKCMFRNPSMISHLMKLVFDAGYFSACDPCADIMEAGQFAELARAAWTVQGGALSPAAVEVAIKEFTVIYSLISRQRETYVHGWAEQQDRMKDAG